MKAIVLPHCLAMRAWIAFWSWPETKARLRGTFSPHPHAQVGAGAPNSVKYVTGFRWWSGAPDPISRCATGWLPARTLPDNRPLLSKLFEALDFDYELDRVIACVGEGGITLPLGSCPEDPEAPARARTPSARPRAPPVSALAASRNTGPPRLLFPQLAGPQLARLPIDRRDKHRVCGPTTAVRDTVEAPQLLPIRLYP